MPSSIGHASVALFLSPALAHRVTGRLVVMTMVAAAIPDIDAIGRPFGRGDIALLGGHRAVTHSIWFALVVAVGIVMITCRDASMRDRWIVGAYVAAVLLSHGVLDAFTTYGEGVAFLAPFSMHRWKADWRPFSGITWEVIALWLPALLVYAIWLRRAIRKVT